MRASDSLVLNLCLLLVGVSIGAMLTRVEALYYEKKIEFLEKKIKELTK